MPKRRMSPVPAMIKAPARVIQQYLQDLLGPTMAEQIVEQMIAWDGLINHMYGTQRLLHRAKQVVNPIRNTVSIGFVYGALERTVALWEDIAANEARQYEREILAQLDVDPAELAAQARQAMHELYPFLPGRSKFRAKT